MSMLNHIHVSEDRAFDRLFESTRHGDLDTILELVKRLDKELGEAKTLLEEMENEKKGLQDELDNANGKLESLQNDYADLETELEEIRNSQ